MGNNLNTLEILFFYINSLIKDDYDGILSKMITVGAFVSYGYGGRAVVSNE